ncbi:YqiA/YcfP family alpha/beta fold hydrolase, partial [Pseudomonas syringae group genomosp. 7]|uniref:YqiA/YcfP family alpha/beta fold hydrolase n=1 Tax=Pseudomonas syringae group genomosp. 7 TaxID=251699 RepID=UPI00377042F5
LKAVLINPAVNPHQLFDAFLGVQQNLYTGEQWQLTEDNIQALAELEVPAPQDTQHFQEWLQTGDDTLDYRRADQLYRASA